MEILGVITLTWCWSDFVAGITAAQHSASKTNFVASQIMFIVLELILRCRPSILRSQACILLHHDAVVMAGRGYWHLTDVGIHLQKIMYENLRIMRDSDGALSCLQRGSSKIDGHKHWRQNGSTDPSCQ